MKSLVLLLACGGAAAAYHHHAPCILSFLGGETCDATGPCSDTGPELDAGGLYVEARDVTVFAGACHYNSEVQRQGRGALVGWSFETGSFGGVDLAGLAVAAAVTSDANLQEGGARRSIVYLDQGADEAEAGALLGWLRRNAGQVLGPIVETRRADVEVARGEGSFVLRAAGELVAEGATMADLSCCTMPENRWYEPLGATTALALVGMSRDCRFDGAETHPAWTYADANNAFVGRFGPPVVAAAGRCAGPSREALSQ